MPYYRFGMRPKQMKALESISRTKSLEDLLREEKEQRRLKELAPFLLKVKEKEGEQARIRAQKKDHLMRIVYSIGNEWQQITLEILNEAENQISIPEIRNRFSKVVGPSSHFPDTYAPYLKKLEEVGFASKTRGEGKDLYSITKRGKFVLPASRLIMHWAIKHGISSSVVLEGKPRPGSSHYGPRHGARARILRELYLDSSREWNRTYLSKLIGFTGAGTSKTLQHLDETGFLRYKAVGSGEKYGKRFWRSSRSEVKRKAKENTLIMVSPFAKKGRVIDIVSKAKEG